MEAKQTPAAISGLLGRQLAISQIAVVCHDLQKTMEQYTNCSAGAPGTCTGTNRLGCTTRSYAVRQRLTR